MAARRSSSGGGWTVLSERTVQRQLARFERGGKNVATLGRNKRSDAGLSRVIVSTAWDAAVPFIEPVRDNIADALRDYVRGLIKAGESTDWTKRLASRKLQELSDAAGHDPGEAACSVPVRFVQAELVFRKAHTFKADRKSYEDRRPRVRRTRHNLAPMDIVGGDIHPVDILVRRADGSIATPRMVAWLDLATNRIWADFVLLDKGKGITNAHVIGSFVAMVAAWGAPRALYIDNGKEYNFAEFIDDALRLIDRDRRRFIDRISPWPIERASNVARAQPYNAAAKPIEGIFSVLEQHYFSTIPGHIGGDRMRKKTESQGNAAEPFPGTFDELRQVLRSQLASYDVTPQRGSLEGRAPRAVYAAAINAGWAMTAIQPDALRIAFSEEQPRIVHQGCVSYAGRKWTCRELQAYQGDRVSILAPKYEDWSRLPVRDDRGQLLGFAEPDKAYGFFERAGAIEAKARADVHRAAVRELDRAAPNVIPIAERQAYMASLPPSPIASIAATIDHNEEAAAIVAGLRETPQQRLTRQQLEWESELQYQTELVERSLAAARRDRA